MTNIKPKKILIIAPNWVGDLVMSQTLYQLIKAREPDSELHLLAPNWCLDVASRMPEITKTISLPGVHGKLELKMRYFFAKKLRNENYDHAYVLPNSLKSALIPWFSQIPKRTGFRGEMRFGLLNDLRPLNKEQLPLMVQRFAALGFNKNELWDKQSFPNPKLKANPDSCKNLLTKHELSLKLPILALAPGAAFGDSKCWPLQHYSALAKHYLDKNLQVWLFASPKEVDALEKINQATNNRCKVLSEPTLGEKVDLLSLVSALVSNDSGLMHIGAALNVPTVGIFGSTSPSFTPPLGEKSRVVQLKELSCRPCFKRHCPKVGKDHLRCLIDIRPTQVISVIDELMSLEERGLK